MTSASKKLAELGAERSRLEAEFSRAKAEWERKMFNIEDQMRAIRENMPHPKVGDIIETRQGPVRISAVFVHHDDISLYGFRRTPSGNWSTKARPLYGWNFLYKREDA